MEKDTILEVQNISKKYCKDLRKSMQYGIQDVFNEVLGRKHQNNRLKRHEFWALHNVSFKLRRGESLGLIGINGSGKTTILKLINGLLKPTKGTISRRGSIGALIALGTGFNPILTGRENVKIAGAVLGMTGKEIEEKLDEIIDFAEIGDFIDAPVKSYSTGMVVRLGFSVAIQIKPDLILIDEVLAVGDLGFQIKCQKKITEYRSSGGSIILVSHAMHNVRVHCDKTLWLHEAKIRMYEETKIVTNAYEQFMSRINIKRGNKFISDESVSIKDIQYKKVLNYKDSFVFEFTVCTKRNIKNPILVFAIWDEKGTHLISNYSHWEGFRPKFSVGETCVKIKFPNLPLVSGNYTLSLILHEDKIGNHLAFYDRHWLFEINNSETNYGIINLKPEWSIVT